MLRAGGLILHRLYASRRRHFDKNQTRYAGHALQFFAPSQHCGHLRPCRRFASLIDRHQFHIGSANRVCRWDNRRRSWRRHLRREWQFFVFWFQSYRPALRPAVLQSQSSHGRAVIHAARQPRRLGFLWVGSWRYQKWWQQSHFLTGQHCALCWP